MKIKSHKEIIDGHNTVTFFTEDVNSNTLIHSDTFIVTKKTKINKLKAEFIAYVTDMQKMELAMLEAKEHDLIGNKKELNFSNN
jgi:hypothetical protein